MDCHGLVSRNAIKTALRSLAKGEPLPLAMGDPSSALSNPAVPASLPDCDGFQHQVAEMAPAMPLSALDLPHGSGKLPPDSLQAGPVPVGLPLGGTWHQRIYFAQTATFCQVQIQSRGKHHLAVKWLPVALQRERLTVIVLPMQLKLTKRQHIEN